MATTQQEENLARERNEIAARVATFKATQEKFEREREQYFATTLANARSNTPRRFPLTRICYPVPRGAPRKKSPEPSSSGPFQGPWRQ